MSDNTQVGFPKRLRQTLEIRRDDILKALPEKIDVDRFITVALMAATKRPELYNCSIESVVLSIMESARVGLYIDNKEAALIPYGGNAEFQPMVQGIINLMLRSPGILKVEARVVYKSDEFGFEYGLYPKLIHKPKPGSREIINAYAIIWREATEPTFEVVDAEEIEKAKKSSRAPNSPAYTKWPGEMARKFVLKRVAKYVDLSPEASRAIAVDHAVTGDPSMVGSVDGLSEEYRNMLVKNQTEQGLVELKERIKPKGNGEKKEEKPAEEPTEEEVEKPIRDLNHWEDYVLDFVVTEQFVSGADEKSMRIHARGILNYSPFVEIPHGELKLVPAVAWFIAWNRITEKHPKMKGENKAKKAAALWMSDNEALLELAKDKCPPDTNND